jgi:hypothetical protein
MAIEDEIINITDIDVGTEILNNDKLIIETNNGTKLIAFKDLVIGEDNITFKDKLIQGADIAGESSTTFSTVTGYKILTSETTAGHVIKYSDISGTVELGKFNYNGITTFAGLSALISQNESEISHLKTQLDLIRTTFSSSSALSSTALTLSAVNFYFENGSSARGSGGDIKFTSAGITVDPTSTNANASYSANPFSITYPDDSSYVGGYVLFNLTLAAPSGASRPKITIYKTTSGGGTSPVWSYNMPKSHTPGTSRVFAHSHIEYVAPGDRISLTSTQFIDKVKFNGFKLG